MFSETWYMWAAALPLYALILILWIGERCGYCAYEEEREPQKKDEAEDLRRMTWPGVIP